jgi:hypothetical protein
MISEAGQSCPHDSCPYQFVQPIFALVAIEWLMK